MLVLSRKQGETIQIDDQIRVTVVRVKGNRVKIGIEAPDNVAVWRGELYSEWEFDGEEVEESDQRQDLAR